MDSKELAKAIVNGLEEKKAEDIKIIDISKISIIADYFIIASGGSHNQVQAISRSVDEFATKAGGNLKQVEGYDSANWILMDFNDCIVHIFSKEDRLFYDIERIWRDGQFLSKEDL